MSPNSSENSRPLSPHLQIYKWKWSMSSSILNRITAAIFLLALFKIMLWVLIVYMGGSVHAFLNSLLVPYLTYPSQFLFLFVIFYHSIQGIQHIIWDFGRGFDITIKQHKIRVTLTLMSSIFLSLVVLIIISL